MSEEEWQGIVEAANAEGRVTVYSVMLPNQNEALEAGFEATYPEIDMEVVRVLGEMDSKLDAEKQTDAEGADVGAHVNYQWILNAAAAGDLDRDGRTRGAAAELGGHAVERRRPLPVLGLPAARDRLQHQPRRDVPDVVHGRRCSPSTTA